MNLNYSALSRNSSTKSDSVELDTFPRRFSWSSSNGMAAATTPVHQTKKQEKRGLKERIFGTKRPSNKGM